MESLSSIICMFSKSDLELSEHIEKILTKRCQITIRQLLIACKDSTTIKKRLIVNSKLHGDNIVILSLKHNCEELFRCIIKILVTENSMNGQLNREAMFHINTAEKFIWIASLEETEIKWIMKQALEAPAHNLFVSTIVKYMDQLGRNMNMFTTGYNPLAHAISLTEYPTYRNIARSAIGHLQWLDGEPIIFHTVETMEFPFMTDKIRLRMNMWQSLITEEVLHDAQVHGTNLFKRAVEYEDIPLITYLIDNHRETVIKLRSEELPLITAIESGAKEVVEILIRANFSSTTKGKNGMTPLQTAFYSPCVRIMELILIGAENSEIYTLDNLCRAMSAQRWWIAKKILDEIYDNYDLVRIFGEGMSYEVVRLQVDTMTTRSMLGKSKKLNQKSPKKAKRDWCIAHRDPDILETKGRDWWHASCRRIHICPGSSMGYQKF